MSELLQYEAEYERETLAKARAVEELCGGSAVIWLPRLIETQAHAFGRSIGLDLPDAEPAPIRVEMNGFLGLQDNWTISGKLFDRDLRRNGQLRATKPRSAASRGRQ